VPAPLFTLSVPPVICISPDAPSPTTNHEHSAAIPALMCTSLGANLIILALSRFAIIGTVAVDQLPAVLQRPSVLPLLHNTSPAEALPAITASTTQQISEHSFFDMIDLRKHLINIGLFLYLLNTTIYNEISYSPPTPKQQLFAVTIKNLKIYL
jgi:hypothetical protein